MIEYSQIQPARVILAELLCPDLVHIYRIRGRCVRNPKRMTWAVSKATSLMWLFLCLVILSANLLVYRHKWNICSMPLKRVSATYQDWDRECAKVQSNAEYLPFVMKHKSVGPLIHQFLVITMLSLMTGYAVLSDDRYLAQLCAYGLANVWYFDFWHNRHILFLIESVLYLMATLFLLIGFLTLFVFCSALEDGFHIEDTDLNSFLDLEESYWGPDVERFLIKPKKRLNDCIN